MDRRIQCGLFALLLVTLPAISMATAINYSYTDPVGDNATTIDLTGMVFDFDNSTGDYAIKMTASSADPFFGLFRINVNIFNPNTGSTTDELFSDTANDYDLSTSLTEIVLTGTNTHLLTWSPGDTIAISTEDGLGNPTGSTGFRTGVNRLDGLPPRETCNEDFIAPGALFYECLAQGTTVPEPPTLALLAIGLAGVGFVKRKKTV